jgi:hypothetical protein
LRARWHRFFFFSLAVAVGLPAAVSAQQTVLSGNFADSLPAVPAPVPVTAPASAPAYVRPSPQQKLNNYLFEAFGPYPLMWTTVVAGYHQAKHTPPDWREGFAGYGERYGSDFGNSAVNISTRYALARALDEDTLYYRCACSGVWPRLEHALYWSAFARRGADGHEAIALPALAGPYVASMTAVYGWYPDRYNAKDAFRMGNYGVMAYVIGNISLEFLAPVLHARRHTIIARLHFDNRHLASEPSAP